jgi:O-antigen/teichoic acid export membrane protein
LSTSARRVPSALSLRANFSWTFVGNVIYAACQWGILVVLTKLGSPEMVGQFALGLAITVPIMSFATLKTRLVQATDAKREYLFGDYFGLRVITTSLALLVITGIVLIADYRPETALVILAVGVAKAFESISDVFYGLLQQRERMDRVAKSMMIKGPLSLVALGIGTYLTDSVFGGAVGLAIAWGLVMIFYDMRSVVLMLKPVPQPGSLITDEGGQADLVRPHWEMKTLASLAWLALPLGVVISLESFATNIPRYFIAEYWGEYELGIFAPLAYFKRAGMIVATALGLSASPRLAQYYAERKGNAYRALLFKLVGVSALLGSAGVLVAVIFGREILTIVYQPEYAEYQDVFVMLMVSSGLAYVATFLDYGMTAARYFRVQLPLFALITGTTAIACLWLVPSQGLRGAAVALIIAMVVRTVGSLAIVLYAMRALRKHTVEHDMST